MRIERLSISWERAEHIAEHGVAPAEAREALEQGKIFKGPKGPHGRTYIVRGRTYSGRPLKLLVQPLGKGLALLITAYEDR